MRLNSFSIIKSVKDVILQAENWKMIKTKIYFIFSVTFLFCVSPGIFSQSLPEQDCISAISVCQDTYIQTKPYSGIGSPTAGQGPDGNEINGAISCLLTGEKNDVWYTFTIQTSGDLCFSIIPSVLTDDFDWAVFNLTSFPCDNIYTNSSLKVECSYIPIPGITGANGITGQAQNTPCLAVNSGETYVLNVSQFTPSANGYTLDFSASTAQLYDNIPPTLQSVTTPIFCGDTQIIISFSENIICSTVQPSDFILKEPSGNLVSIFDITSMGCTKGSSYDNQYIFTISPISSVGYASLELLGSAGVQDLCSNSNLISDTVIFSVSPFPVTVSTTSQVCSNNNGTATAAAAGGIDPYTYSWNSPLTQVTQTATGLFQGVYTVSVTDAVGCKSSGWGIVGLDPGSNPPIANINSSLNATCSGINDGSATVSVSGGLTPYNYSWNSTVPQFTQTATGLAPEVIVCSVSDLNGCIDTAAVTISNLIPIVISASPEDTFICNGGGATLYTTVGGGADPYKIEWFNNGILEASGDSFTINPSATITYNVLATDSMGCMSDSASVKINVYSPITITFSPVTTLCPGKSLELSANASGGKGNEYSYTWGGSDTGKTVNVSPSVSSTYYVTVTDNCTSVNGVGSVFVNVAQYPPAIEVLSDPIEGCVPLSVQFQADPFIPGYIYKWNFGEGSLLTTASEIVTHNYLVGGCKQVVLSLITNENCPFDSIFLDTCLINAFASPSAEFTFSPQGITTINPIVSFFDGSTGAEEWNWDFGDNSSSDLSTLQHEYKSSGRFLVKLVVSNDFCTDTVEHTLIIENESTIYFPNTFTPDEDGLNDVFIPHFEGLIPENSTMFIFDRAGQIIYQTDRLIPWDGKSKGSDAKQGVYLYQVNYETLKGEKKLIRGTLTLLR